MTRTHSLLLALSFTIVACDSHDKSSSAAEPAPASAKPTASSLPASSTSSAPSSELRTACERTCAAGAALRCTKQSECVAACASNMQFPGCDRELLAFMACSAHEPAAHWECNDGIPALKDGSCEAEQASVGKCVSEHAPAAH